MSFTSKCLYLSDTISVADSQHKHSNLVDAINKLILDNCSVNDENRFLNTIACGLSGSDENKDFINEILTAQKIDYLQKMCQDRLDLIPSENKPICDQTCKTKMIIFCKLLNFKECVKAPGIHLFPGDFEDVNSVLRNTQIKFESIFDGVEWHSTGYYLPAGVLCKIKVIKCHDFDSWKVRIGAHSDDLSNCESIKRWPCISSVYPVNETMEISSPYGGLIYFESSKRKVKIEAILNNVVESPYFDLTNPNTVNEWSKRKNAPGLWAELAGKNIIFTTPSSCIRGIQDPKPVLEFWDQVVNLHHQLRGTLASDQKRERVVNDQQPSAGYMHSGYPIVTCLDVCQKEHEFCQFDLNKLKTKGNWGLFHGKEYELIASLNVNC